MIVCPRRPRVAVAAVGIIAVLTLSCGGGNSPLHRLPPSLVATPAPTPTPTSGGGDSFSHMSCPFGKGDVNASCERRSSMLLSELEAAMETLIRQKPQIFDLNDEYAPGTRAFRVLDNVAYAEGLVANLRSAGICSERDPDDAMLETIKAKNSSEFSEDFDVLL